MAIDATILLSGGIDSAVCMQLLRSDGYRLVPVFVDFGQAAAVQEWRSVKKICEHFNCRVTKVTLRTEQQFGSGEIRGRNAFLLSAGLMTSPAASGLMVIGIHAGTPYYDCNPTFFERMAVLISENSDGRFSLAAPLLRWTKSQIYDYFRKTDIEHDSTYSCEEGVPNGCGRCLSCLDRKML
jgi:7-cyano-7-deazaguanine synthase